MPESVRLCPFHMPFGIPYNLTGDLLALPTIDKRSLHNSITQGQGWWHCLLSLAFIIEKLILNRSRFQHKAVQFAARLLRHAGMYLNSHFLPCRLYA